MPILAMLATPCLYLVATRTHGLAISSTPSYSSSSKIQLEKIVSSTLLEPSSTGGTIPQNAVNTFTVITSQSHTESLNYKARDRPSSIIDSAIHQSLETSLSGSSTISAVFSSNPSTANHITSPDIARTTSEDGTSQSLASTFSSTYSPSLSFLSSSNKEASTNTPGITTSTSNLAPTRQASIAPTSQETPSSSTVSEHTSITKGTGVIAPSTTPFSAAASPASTVDASPSFSTFVPNFELSSIKQLDRTTSSSSQNSTESSSTLGASLSISETSPSSFSDTLLSLLTSGAGSTFTLSVLSTSGTVDSNAPTATGSLDPSLPPQDAFGTQTAIGIALGAVFLLAVLAGFLFYFYRRSSRCCLRYRRPANAVPTPFILPSDWSSPPDTEKALTSRGHGILAKSAPLANSDHTQGHIDAAKGRRSSQQGARAGVPDDLNGFLNSGALRALSALTLQVSPQADGYRNTNDGTSAGVAHAELGSTEQHDESESDDDGFIAIAL